jgi:hypothetical protein
MLRKLLYDHDNMGQVIWALGALAEESSRLNDLRSARSRELHKLALKLQGKVAMEIPTSADCGWRADLAATCVEGHALADICFVPMSIFAKNMYRIVHPAKSETHSDANLAPTTTG